MIISIQCLEETETREQDLSVAEVSFNVFPGNLQLCLVFCILLVRVVF